MDGQTTLVGIVSGGLGCGNGIPNWYTRVSFYEEWIACIQEKSRELKNFVQVSLDNNLAQKRMKKFDENLKTEKITHKQKVEAACKNSAKQLPLCSELLEQDELFGDEQALGTCRKEEQDTGRY